MRKREICDVFKKVMVVEMFSEIWLFDRSNATIALKFLISREEGCQWKRYRTNLSLRYMWDST